MYVARQTIACSQISAVPNPVFDGMKVDGTGNVYCGGSGGHLDSGSEGQKARTHRPTASRRQPNLAFGGPNWKTSISPTWNFLGAVNLRIAGMPVPAIKRHKRSPACRSVVVRGR